MRASWWWRACTSVCPARFWRGREGRTGCEGRAYTGKGQGEGGNCLIGASTNAAKEHKNAAAASLCRSEEALGPLRSVSTDVGRTEPVTPAGSHNRDQKAPAILTIAIVVWTPGGPCIRPVPGPVGPPKPPRSLTQSGWCGTAPQARKTTPVLFNFWTTLPSTDTQSNAARETEPDQLSAGVLVLGALEAGYGVHLSTDGEIYATGRSVLPTHPSPSREKRV